MESFPNKIEFLSDGCIAELVSEVVDKKSKERNANYRYVKSVTNNGKVFILGLKQIESLFNSQLILCQN